MPDPTATPENPFPESAGTLMEKWGKLRIANNALNMLNLQRTQNNCHKHDSAWRKMGMDMLNWRNKMMGVEPSAATSKEEDMEVRFDSPQTVTNHYHPKPGLGTIAKLALGAGLIASGAGIGIGLPLILSALKPKPPVVQPQQDQDSDTATELNFWDK